MTTIFTAWDPPRDGTQENPYEFESTHTISATAAHYLNQVNSNIKVINTV